VGSIKPYFFESWLLSRKKLTDKFVSFVFKPEKKIVFEAGQYVSVKINEEGIRRPYSVVNRPGDDVIELLVDVSPDGVGVRFLLGLKEEDRVEMMGPVGRFTIGDVQEDDEIWFVGTGSGIAPLRSMILDLLENRGVKNRVKLLWGMRHEKDFFWRKELVDLSEKFVNFDYKVSLSLPGKGWKGLTGRVTEYLDKVSFSGKECFYICGGGEMVLEVRRILQKKGIEEGRIFFERFS